MDTNRTMVTLQELNALIELASRAHKSQAEALWLEQLVRKANEQMKQEQPPPQKTIEQ